MRQKSDISEQRSKQPSTITLFATGPLGHCATCKGSSYTEKGADEHIGSGFWDVFKKYTGREGLFVIFLFQKKTYLLENTVVNCNIGILKKSLAQEMRQKRDISERRSKGWR